MSTMPDASFFNTKPTESNQATPQTTKTQTKPSVPDASFFNAPTEKPISVPTEGREGRESASFQEGYLETKAILDNKFAKIRQEEKKQSAENIAKAKKRATTITADKLEESWTPEFFDGRKFTNDSLVGYYNKLTKKDKIDPKVALNMIHKQGATPGDMIAIRREIAGAPKAGTELVKLPGKMADIATSTGLGVVMGLNDLTVATRSMLANNNPFMSDEENKNLQAELSKYKGQIKAAEDAYAEQYGAGIKVGRFIGREAPLAFVGGQQLLNAGRALKSAKVVKKALDPKVLDTVSKVALVDASKIAPIAAEAAVAGGATYLTARADDYSPDQAIAQSIIGATVGGSLATVGKVAEKLVNTKVASGKNGLDEFTSLADLPGNLKAMVKDIKAKNPNWTDDTITDMIKGYKEGAESGQLNAIDAVRMLAVRGGGGEVKNALKRIVFANEATARQYAKETSTRADNMFNLVNSINSKEARGIRQILSTNRISADFAGEASGKGAKGINWMGVQQKLDEMPELYTPQTARLFDEVANNNKLYGSYDATYLDLLNKEMGTIGQVTTGAGIKDTVAELVQNIGYAFVGKSIAKAAGSPFFMRQNTANTITSYLFKSIGKLLPETQVTKYGRMIEQSLNNGTYMPKGGDDQLRAMFPQASDDVIEAIDTAMNKADVGLDKINYDLKRADVAVSKAEQDLAKARNKMDFEGTKKAASELDRAKAVQDSVKLAKKGAELELLKRKHGYVDDDLASAYGLADDMPTPNTDKANLSELSRTKVTAGIDAQQARLNNMVDGDESSRAALGEANIAKAKADLAHARQANNYDGYTQEDVTWKDAKEAPTKPTKSTSAKPTKSTEASAKPTKEGSILEAGLPKQSTVTEVTTKGNQGIARLKRLIENNNKTKTKHNAKVIDEVNKGYEQQIKALQQKEHSVSTPSRLDRKMADLGLGRGGSVAGKVRQRLARREYLPKVFGKDFADEFEKAHEIAKASGDKRSADDIISDYIITYIPVNDKGTDKVARYYRENPSYINIGDSKGFGVPKKIRDKYGLDYNEVTVPEQVLDRMKTLKEIHAQ